jgi:hypothetical protein
VVAHHPSPRHRGLLFAVAYYIVDIDNLPSAQYAGRVVTAHRSLPLVVASCRVLADWDRRRGLVGGTLRIVFSEFEFFPRQYIPSEDAAAAYATDGTPLT